MQFSVPTMEVAPVMLTNTTILFHRAMFQVIKELYIQVTDPSALIMSSAVQNKNEFCNDIVYMWQLCP